MLEATPRRKGQIVLPLTRPSYGGTKCQPLLHSAQDRWRQAAIPHSGCDRSPVRQLRSLLCHPGRCGNTVGTCDVVRDVLGTAPITILPTPAVRTPPHHTNGPGPVPCSGRDPASPRVPQGGMLSTSSRRPGSPLSRGPGPPCDSWTPLAHGLALHLGGPVPPRAPLPLAHIYMQDPGLQGTRNAATPPLEDGTPYSDDHAACWG